MANRYIEVIINAKDKASAKINGATKNMGGLKKAVVAVGVAGAAAAALFVAAAVKMINATAKQVAAAISLGDQYDKMSKRLDVSVESLSEWAFIVERAGGSAAVFEIGMKGLITQMKAAKDGTKLSIDAFKDLGVNIKESNGDLRNSEDVFEDVVASISALKSPTEQAAAAIQIFGKSGLKLLPTIRQTNEEIEKQKDLAGDLGLVLSKEFTDGAAAMNDSLDLLKQASGGLGRELVATFGSDTAVLIETLALELTDLFDVFQTDGLGASDIMLELGKVMDDVNNTVRVVGVGFKVAAAAKALFTQVNDVDSYRAAMNDLTTAVMDYNSVLLQISKESNPFEKNILEARKAREDIKAELENQPEDDPIEVPVKLVPQDVIAPPKITEAAIPYASSDSLDLIEDIIEAERLMAEQAVAGAGMTGEALLAQDELLRQNRSEIEEMTEAWKAQEQAAAEAQERAMDAAQAAGRIGQATVTAFLNGENAAKAFGDAIKREIIAAIAKAISQMIILAAFNFITGGIGGGGGGGATPFAAGGSPLKAAAGLTVKGGKPGMDSVAASLMPGETVVSRSTTQQLKSFLDSRESASMANPADLRVGGSGGVTVIQQVGRPINYLDNLALGEAAVISARKLAEANL